MFNRKGSTLGIMDDLQIVVHSYDGCPRGCAGCLVDKRYKNQYRYKTLIDKNKMRIINNRVLEYKDWVVKERNLKDGGYFSGGDKVIRHHSYTYRFGNHAELDMEQLYELSQSFETDYRVFSISICDESDMEKFVRLKKEIKGEFLGVEIIYDPTIDSSENLKRMILFMRDNDIKGYPEIVITKKLVSTLSPEDFVYKHIEKIKETGIQIQFGRYVPSKTRNFARSQCVYVDEEIEWLKEVSRLIVSNDYNVSPIPLGEYAVTFLDEYNESQAYVHGFGVDESLLPQEEKINISSIFEKVKDIFLTSIYIDENLDVYLWAESMGQHVLDHNFGFKTLGNLNESSLIEIMGGKKSKVDSILRENIRHLISHEKCGKCRYLSFCASHAIPFFRKAQEDDGKYCYGYIPVIREYQKNINFLQRMIDGFREINF